MLAISRHVCVFVEQKCGAQPRAQGCCGDASRARACATCVEPAVAGAAAATSGSAARCFRNDRRIISFDLTRNRLHRAILRTILAAAGLPSWFRLLWWFRLSSCSAIAVKRDAVRAQIADQRVQIVGQLLIV